MAWEDFFNHRCSIFHIKQQPSDLGYGVENEHSFGYGEEADLADVKCHFGVKTGEVHIAQKDPFNEYYARIKLTLPIGTDIRVNDKVISRESGFSYIAEVPRVIQEHHIIVYIHRDGTVQEAI
jgi:hypothetical protein